MALHRMQGSRRIRATASPPRPPALHTHTPRSPDSGPSHYLRGMLIIHPRHTRGFITLPPLTAITISLYDCFTCRTILTKTCIFQRAASCGYLLRVGRKHRYLEVFMSVKGSWIMEFTVTPLLTNPMNWFENVLLRKLAQQESASSNCETSVHLLHSQLPINRISAFSFCCLGSFFPPTNGKHIFNVPITASISASRRISIPPRPQWKRIFVVPPQR